MPLKFSANLSTMFTDLPLEERFNKAKKLGFHGIEIQNPYTLDKEVLNSKLQGMQLDLINTPGGLSGFGCASVISQQNEFYKSFELVKSYHSTLNFNKLHILSGEIDKNYTKDEQTEFLKATLESLVEYLDDMNIIGLIEPICTEVNPKYFLNDFETAVKVLNEVKSDKIKLLLDIFHLHNITGDVKKYLPIYYPYAGHIQVSQVPGRKEPFCDGGVIDYNFVFNYLQEKVHMDFIGLEYYPSDSTAEGFKWMKKYSG